MGLFSKKKPDANQLLQQPVSRQQAEAEKIYREGVVRIRDLIAPPSMDIKGAYLQIGKTFTRTLFIYAYPRTLYTGWLSPIINMDQVLDVSMFIYPVESQIVLENLKKKVTQLEASYSINQEKGRVRDPGLEAAIGDAEELRDKLSIGESKFFRAAVYITIYSNSLEELDQATKIVETQFGSRLIYTKPATLQMEHGFNSTIPLGSDQLNIYRNMDTGSLSTLFPFTSADLTSSDGILYGINRHNNGLVLFDRFKLENANMVVFAKSGSGKSYAVKLEALRSLMFGTEVLIVDPENEYQRLCAAVGGTFIDVSLTSNQKVNPFDLPRVIDPEEANTALQSNIITLHGLLRLMLGGVSAEEDSTLDLALITTYSKFGVTNDPLTHQGQMPTMNDLFEVLRSTPGGASMAQRLRKFTEGTFAGIFSQQTNIDLNNPFVVFNIQSLEDHLRPVAMYIILNHIWNRIKTEKKKRLLIVDEAWNLMQYEDSANFMFSIAKRARKYYLGLTTISQSVEDFLSSHQGREVVNNSSLQLLLKQSPSAAEMLGATFKLTEEERSRLTNFPVGRGLFFAGQAHVIIDIRASATEHELVTTNPQELMARQQEAQVETEEDLPPTPMANINTGGPLDNTHEEII